MFNKIRKTTMNKTSAMLVILSMSAVAFAKPKQQSQTRLFSSEVEATKYYRELEKNYPVVASSTSRGGGRGSTTYTTETRYYSGSLYSEANYLGSTFSWEQYSHNTCGTVVPYPDSNWTVEDVFEYTKSKKMSERHRGMLVSVKIGVSSPAPVSASTRLRAMKNLVESGGNYRDDAGKPRRLLPLQKVLRMRYRFRSHKMIYWDDRAGFLLFDVDPTKVDKTVSSAVFAK